MRTPTIHRFSRRELLAGAAALAAGACLGPSAWRVLAEEAATKEGVVEMMRNGAAAAKVESQALRNGVHALIGSGGNIGVLAGADGLLLVDTGLAGSRPQLTKALAALSDKPLTRAVDTHWHFDHCDGNAWVRAAGATLLAHPNTKKHLAQVTRVPDWDFTFPPNPEADLPNELVEDKKDLKLNDNAVAIRHYGYACHTDGDLYVHFPDADALHTGDTFWNGHYPFIDTANGGSIGGTIRATEENLKRTGEKTIVIPGHGPVAARADLTDFWHMLTDVRDAVAKLKKEGKTVEESVAAKPTARWDAKYAGFVITPEHFTRIAYAGV